jgi:hypothetical protein
MGIKQNLFQNNGTGFCLISVHCHSPWPDMEIAEVKIASIIRPTVAKKSLWRLT